MAFTRKHLGRVSSGANGFSPTVWSYKTDDTHATVDTEDYFLDAINEIRLGDIIWVLVVTDLDVAAEAIATYGHHLCTVNAAGVINMSAVTVGVVTDAD